MDEKDILLKTLTRIKDRAQLIFDNPLVIKCFKDDDPYDPLPIIYLIAEVKTIRFWRIFTRKEYDEVCAIIPKFILREDGKKRVLGGVSNRSILEIVREELSQCADTNDAIVELTERFSD